MFLWLSGMEAFATSFVMTFLYEQGGFVIVNKLQTCSKVKLLEPQNLLNKNAIDFYS